MPHRSPFNGLRSGWVAWSGPVDLRSTSSVRERTGAIRRPAMPAEGAADLGRWPTALARCCPWLSDGVWPRCGPTIPSLEGASCSSVQPGCYVDGASQVRLRPTAVNRETARCRCYGHAEGTAGEDEVGSGVAATVTSSGDGRGSSRRPLASLASAPLGARQLASAYPLTYALAADRHAGAIIGVDAEETRLHGWSLLAPD